MEFGKHFLCTPAEPCGTIERAPFVCGDQRWDGGEFGLFANRTSSLHRVPYDFREIDDGTPWTEREPSTDPTRHAEQQAFYQTWFFFGLLAEFFGYNDKASQSTHHRATEKSEQLQQLYRDFIFWENGTAYLTIERVPRQDVATAMCEGLGNNRDERSSRVQYLTRCLRLTGEMVGMKSADLDPSVSSSIRALGEVLTKMLENFLRGEEINFHGYTWVYEYFQRATSAHIRMIDAGWCPSDVERTATLYRSVNTQHFISHLKNPRPHRNHSNCTTQICNAAQINPKEYTLSHADGDCSGACLEIHVDLAAFPWKSSAFPLLCIEGADRGLGEMTLSYELYKEDQPYIAISHVWADGLGNQKANALQRCQVRRLFHLLKQLQEVTNANERFLLWIDTLCCPATEDIIIDVAGFETSTKQIAIARLPEVYRQASHVLVLDESMSSVPSKNTHPAEICLRALALSTWMRRLWTLQEGALANSVYFQFADYPVSLVTESNELFKIGVKDARYMAIWSDVESEIRNFQSFFRMDLPTPEEGQVDYRFHMQLFDLQEALQHRAVSFEADEPLCIATMLSLDLQQVLAVKPDLDSRMQRVWELFAESGGGIPPRIIFYVEDPIRLKGFGWAPRSLLGSKAKTALTLAHLKNRFTQKSLPSNESLAANMQELVDSGLPTESEHLASILSCGLKVKFPGVKIHVKPWRQGGSLFEWSSQIKNVSSGLLCRDEAGTWSSMDDLFRGVLKGWAPEEPSYDLTKTNPLLEDLRHRNMYLIEDPDINKDGSAEYAILVEQRKQNCDHNEESMHVYIRRMILLSQQHTTYAKGLEAFRNLAKRELTQCKSGDMTHLKNVSSIAYDCDPDIRKFMLEELGMDSRRDAWIVIPYFLPFDVTLETTETCSWIVDREI